MAGIAGGVVGVGGTYLGAWRTGRTQTANLKLSINAESESARLTDKRLVYARYLASLSGVLMAGTKLAAYGDANSEERKALELAFGESHGPMITALSEVGLVAPEAVRRLADEVAAEVTRALGDSERGTDPAFQFIPLRDRLLRAMRADLGEPVQAVLGPARPAFRGAPP